MRYLLTLLVLMVNITVCHASLAVNSNNNSGSDTDKYNEAHSELTSVAARSIYEDLKLAFDEVALEEALWVSINEETVSREDTLAATHDNYGVVDVVLNFSVE